MISGRKRVLKFRIGAKGNKAYEELLNDPLVKVSKEHLHNSFEELFITVWFGDLNDPPFDPSKYMPKKSKKSDAEELGDEFEIPNE